jgi:hypothetical protein
MLLLLCLVRICAYLISGKLILNFVLLLISGNVIGESGSRALGSALTFTPNMVELILQSESLFGVFVCLRNHSTKKFIMGFPGCKLGSRGVCSIVSSLSRMPNLANLDLRGKHKKLHGIAFHQHINYSLVSD